LPYRNDFVAFTKKCFSTLRPGEPIQGTYVDYLAARLTALCNGDPARIVVNLPPRHFKTGICGVCVAAWEMANRPWNTVLLISGSDLLGSQTLASLQTIMSAPWYRNAFGIKVVASNADGLKTAQGGGVRVTSIGGHFTGLGADLIAVDDLVDIKDARNLIRLLQVNSLFDSKVESRLNNPATDRIIVIAHRLSEDDLSGHLLRSDTDWQHIKLPLVAQEPEHLTSNGVEFRRDVGELLRPNCYTEKQLRKLQRQTDPVDYETLYQQNPGGRLFAKLDPSCIGTHTGNVFDKLPLVVSVDPARSPSSSSSFSVIQAWVPFADKHILVGQYRNRPSFEELRAVLNKFCRNYLPSIVLIEDNNNAAGLAHKLGGSKFNTQLVPVDGRNKSERLEPHIPLIRNGGIQVHASVDRDEFIAELVEFPSGKFTDQVDALTQYLDYATTHTVPPRRDRAIFSIARNSFRL
jgi:phage terminase large subunit-like protein